MGKEWEGIKEETEIALFESGNFYIRQKGKINTFVAKFIHYRDAELFADALNTIQKCNKMPSELLDENCGLYAKNDLQAEKIIKLKEQRDELLRLLEKVAYRQSLDDIKYYKELLNKINNGE